MERNLYPVFDVNLLFTLWNTAILRHDSVSRPIKKEFVNTGVWPSMPRFHAIDPDHLRQPHFGTRCIRFASADLYTWSWVDRATEMG